MRVLSRSIVMFSLMVGAALGAIAVRPAPSSEAAGPAYQLEEIVPRAFGEWREVPDRMVLVVNPQQQELLDKLYSQLLSRTYVNAAGYRVMLSMAYGYDQRGGLEAHMPDICYPAQGFTLHSKSQATLSTPHGEIPVRRINTSIGSRHEPVTYWFNFGDRAVVTESRLEKRLIEIRVGLTGKVPDGLLVRVSSIDDQPDQAYTMHQAFVRDLLAGVDPEARRRLSNLPL